MRVEALKLMRLLRSFKPRLIGSVMTGHVRKGSDIDIHLFTDSPALVTGLLESEGYQFDLERKQVLKHNEARVFTHVHVYDRFNFELTIYAADKAHYVFKSSITGKAIERASVRELEELLAEKYDHVVIDSPPLLAVTDARIIAASADATVLVLRAGKSNRKLSELSIDGLVSVGARLLGAVVNDVRRRGYRYYGSYGRYGYGDTSMSSSDR